MAIILFWTNALCCLYFFVQGLHSRVGYLELPFLASIFYLVWYVPQVFVLLDSDTVNPASLNRLQLMSLLCFLLLTLGWKHSVGSCPRKIANLTLPIRRLVLPVIAITAFAWLMNFLILSMPASARTAGQWSGPITILAFFSSVGLVSMTLSVAMLVHRPSLITFSLAAANAILYYPKVFIFFRRADTLEFFLAVLLSVWFVAGKRVPKALLVCGIIVGVFYLQGVGELRSLGGGYRVTSTGTIDASVPTIGELLAVDWTEVAALPDEYAPSESRNAVFYMEAVAAVNSLTLGAELWNNLVHSYVPGQIVGYQLKRDLMIGVSLSELAAMELGYATHTGMTATGFAHLYRDFWYVGSLVFYVTGLLAGKLYSLANLGSLMGFLLYSCTLTNALHSVTHFGYYFFVNSVLIVLTILVTRPFFRRQGARAAQQVAGGIAH